MELLIAHKSYMCNACCMTSSEQHTVRVPEWDVADRMRKALRVSGVGVQEMADYLGVARNTVSTWINGKIDPSVQTLRLWALRTGVPFEWLQTGEDPRPDNPGGGLSTVRHQGLEPRTRWLVASHEQTSDVIDFRRAA